MTDFTQPPYFWHGEGPYYHQPPDRLPCCVDHAEKFTLLEKQAGVSVHEAGHTVAAFLLGVHVPLMGIETTEMERGCGPVMQVTGAVAETAFTGVGRQSALTVLAAGVAAEKRWLMHTGLMTEERVFYAERNGRSDCERAQKLTWDNLGAPMDIAEYWGHWVHADHLLSPHWNKVIDLAEHMMQGPLSGDRAAAVCGLINPATHL